MAKKRTSRALSPGRSQASDDRGFDTAQDRPLKHPALAALRSRDAAGWAAIFCATLIVYLPALQGTPLWDDSGHLTRPDLQSLHGLWRIWFELGATQQYYPLLHSAFWLEYRLWGNAPASSALVGYHLVGITLHALCACLVVAIVRRLALPGAWLAGFVFALHPVCVEAVAWISEQKSTLSGVFCLGALFVYLNFDRTRRRSEYLLATGLFVLALLSKTVTATLPAALLVIFWWQRGRLEGRRDVLPLIPWFALGASAGIFTAWVERTQIGAHGAAYLLSPAQRVQIAGRAIWFYAGKLLWPQNLIFSYPRWKPDPTQWWQWLFPAGVVAVGIGCGLLARRYRGPLASFLLFSGTLFPVLGFLNVYPFRYSYVADHFQYLASLAIIIPVTSALTAAAERHWSGRRLTKEPVALACAAALILVPGVLAWRQSHVYSDGETLFRAILTQNPESYMAHDNLGFLLARKQGGLADAVAEYQTAERIEPESPEAHYGLGMAFTQMPGRLQDAIAEFQTALRLLPGYAEAHNGLGIALERIPGRLPEAEAEYEAALRIVPNSPEGHLNLANLFARTPGRLQDAIAQYETLARIQPDNVQAHKALAILFARMPGRLQDAIAQYETVARIQPENPQAHNDLGMVLARTPGRLQEAIADYQWALRMKPDYADAHNNLGNALAQIPERRQEAVAEYQAALRIEPNLLTAHTNLGNVLVQMPGRTNEAIEAYHAALRLKPDAALLHYRLGFALTQAPGRLPEAVAEYREALRISPDYADAHLGLGNALAQMPGQKPQAIAELQAALRINPDSQPARRSLEQLRAAR